MDELRFLVLGVLVPSLSGSGLGLLLSAPPLRPMCDDPASLVLGANALGSIVPSPAVSGPLLRVGTIPAGLAGTGGRRGTDPLDGSLPGWSDDLRCGGGGSWLVDANWAEGALPCVALLLDLGGGGGGFSGDADGHLGGSGGSWPD